MRRRQLNHTEPLVIPAAHSRVIQPGAVVDFDEVVFPGNGTPYPLEVALGPDAEKFSPASAPEPEPEPTAVLEEEVQPASAPAPEPELRATGRGRKKP